MPWQYRAAILYSSAPGCRVECLETHAGIRWTVHISSSLPSRARCTDNIERYSSLCSRTRPHTLWQTLCLIVCSCFCREHRIWLESRDWGSPLSRLLLPMTIRMPITFQVNERKVLPMFLEENWCKVWGNSSRSKRARHQRRECS